MPLIRYEVTLSEDAQRYPTAFAPIPASTVSKYANNQAQGWTLTGQPGTRAVPAPYPAGAIEGMAAAPGSPSPGGSGGAMAGGSRYAPPVWYPSLYYARQVRYGSIGGVMIYSDNEPPLPTRPAADTRWVPGKYRRTWPWMNDHPVMAAPPLPRWHWWRGRHAPLARTGRRPTDG